MALTRFRTFRPADRLPSLIFSAGPACPDGHWASSLPLLQAAGQQPHRQPVAGYHRKFKYHPDRDLKPPPKFENTQMPDRYRLPIMPRQPTIWTTGLMKPPRQTKELWRMKGEEQVNTDLLLDQFGIISTTGGMLKHAHFEVMRMGIGRMLKNGQTFALYRVDAPYKPITDHGFGKRMGGGKGAIKEYGTPVKAGRVVVEVAGRALWEEVQPWLARVAAKLPFEALAVNAEQLQRLRAEEARLVAENTNQLSFEWLVRNNMLDCQRKVSLYDQVWFGKYVYLDRQNNKKFQSVTKLGYRGKK